MKTPVAFFPFLLLAVVGCRVAPHSHIDPELVAFIPPDSLALAGAGVERLRATPLYQKLAAAGRLPRFEEFRAETGVDPERDLSEVLLANDGPNTLFMARGNFHPRVSASLKAGAYGGYMIYETGEGAAFAFVGAGTALAGPVATVHAAIDRFKSGRRDGPRALIDRATRLPGEAQVWAVMDGWRGFRPEALREMGNAANLNRVLASVASGEMTVDLSAGFRAAAALNCRSEQDARSLSESLTGLAVLGRMAVPKNRPEMLRAFDAIQIRQEMRSVKLAANLPEDLAEQLALAPE